MNNIYKNKSEYRVLFIILTTLFLFLLSMLAYGIYRQQRINNVRNNLTSILQNINQEINLKNTVIRYDNAGGCGIISNDLCIINVRLESPTTGNLQSDYDYVTNKLNSAGWDTTGVKSLLPYYDQYDGVIVNMKNKTKAILNIDEKSPNYQITIKLRSLYKNIIHVRLLL
jgi:hypothetical protein